jgi:hypothetical protein
MKDLDLGFEATYDIQKLKLRHRRPRYLSVVPAEGAAELDPKLSDGILLLVIGRWRWPAA